MPNKPPIIWTISNNCSPQEKYSIFLPATERHTTPKLLQCQCSTAIRGAEKTQLLQKKKIIVTYPQALFEKVISQHTLKRKTLTVKTGDVVGLDFINETLFEYGFDRVNFVTQPGEFSVRGGSSTSFLLPISTLSLRVFRRGDWEPQEFWRQYPTLHQPLGSNRFVAQYLKGHF